MPITGYICPPFTKRGRKGKTGTPEYCVTRCKEKCLSPALIAAITYVNSSNHHVGRYVSATSTTGCIRRLTLERTKPYFAPLNTSGGLWASFRGTIIHTAVEAAAEAKLFDGKSLIDLGFLIEQHLKVGWCLACSYPFTCAPDAKPDTFAEACPTCESEETFLFGGTLDILAPAPFYGYGKFDPETGVLTAILEDCKTMSDGYALDHFILGNNPDYEYHRHVKDEYVIQASLYAFLLRFVPIPESLREKGVKEIVVDHSRIQAISMSKGAYTGSSVMHKRHYSKPEEAFEIPVVDFLPDEKIIAHIQKEGRAIYDSLVTGRKRGPIVKPSKNRKHPHSFMCGLCAFVDTEHCPNSDVEWKALQRGETEDEAFDRALRVFRGEEEAPPPPPKEEKPKKVKGRTLPAIEGTPDKLTITKKAIQVVQALHDGAAIFEETDPKHRAILMGGKLQDQPAVSKAAIDSLWKNGWLTQDGQAPNFRYTLTQEGKDALSV